MRENTTKFLFVCREKDKWKIKLSGRFNGRRLESTIFVDEEPHVSQALPNLYLMYKRLEK